MIHYLLIVSPVVFPYSLSPLTLFWYSFLCARKSISLNSPEILSLLGFSCQKEPGTFDAHPESMVAKRCWTWATVMGDFYMCLVGPHGTHLLDRGLVLGVSAMVFLGEINI